MEELLKKLKINTTNYKLYEQACKDSNTNIELNYDSKNNIIAYRDISVSFNDVASNLLKRDNLIELLQQG